MSTIAFDDSLETAACSFQTIDDFACELSVIDAKISRIAREIINAKTSEIRFFTSQVATFVKEFNTLQQDIQRSPFSVELQSRVNVLQEQIDQLQQGLAARRIDHVRTHEQRMLETFSKQLLARGVTDQNFHRVNLNVKPPVIEHTQQGTNVTLTDSRGNLVVYSYTSNQLTESSSLETRLATLNIKMGHSSVTLEPANFQFCSDNTGIAAWEGRETAIRILTFEAEKSRLEKRESTGRSEDNNSSMAPHIARVKETEDKLKNFGEIFHKRDEYYYQLFDGVAFGFVVDIIGTYRKDPSAAGQLCAKIFQLFPEKLKVEWASWDENRALWEYAIAKADAFYAEYEESERRMKDFENKCKGRDGRD
ncbi:MAG TPA: hypothetical protein VLG44_04135 [Chlamydiales bacterium]|nr:hypothetical protein [Chlamydiales bacterium]